MDSLQIWLAVPFAIGIPALFLLLIYYLDLYASSTFRLVVLCFAWGTGGGLGLAYAINTHLALPLLEDLGLNRILLYVLLAPVTEEIAKSLILFPVSRRPSFTYFVDGAVYGFASGIGFSIAENFLYIARHPAVAISLASLRAFSTCLMHGAATALVGAAIGRFRLAQRSPRWPLMVSGWIPAILVHILFNGVVLAAAVEGQLRVLAAVGIGFGGLAVTALFVFLGLREQRRWLVESLDQHMVDLVNADLTPQEREWLANTLDREAGVTVAEVHASQAYEVLEDVLGPIGEQFPRKAELVERIVLQQAQIGIKRRVLDELDDGEMKRQLAHEIARLREDTKRLRREAGLCAMTYLQCVFDPQDNQVSRCLEQWMVCDTSQGGDEAGAGAGCSAERQSDRALTADATSG